MYHRSHELPRLRQTFATQTRSLISRHRQMLSTMLGRRKPPVGPRSTRYPRGGSTILPQRLGATPRLGLDTVLPSRHMCELMMKCTKIRNVTFSRSNSFKRANDPLDDLAASFDPGNSSLTVSTRRITYKGPSKSVGLCCTSGKRTRADDDDDSALLAVYQHDIERRRLNIRTSTLVCSVLGRRHVNQHCL